MTDPGVVTKRSARAILLSDDRWTYDEACAGGGRFAELVALVRGHRARHCRTFGPAWGGSMCGGCVEVATIPGWIGVRDTKLGPDSPVLAFTPTEWDAFTQGVRGGEFDLGAR